MKKIGILAVLLTVLLSCFAPPALSACSTPPALGNSFATWAASATVLVKRGGVPKAPIQEAAIA
jgi:hypothetical protein